MKMKFVDSRFNEDSKNIILFAREASISGEGRPENVGKMAIKTEEPIVMQIGGVVNSDREYWPLLHGIKIFPLLWFSYILDQTIC